MSRFSLSRFFRPLSRKTTARREKAHRGGRDSRRPTYRQMAIDPLEERQMLTVSASTVYDIAVAENILGTEYMVAGQSIAVDNDGDFVATWQRTDAAGDTNIYARYFTDQSERLTLPEEIFEQGAGATIKLTLVIPVEADSTTANTTDGATSSATQQWETYSVPVITLSTAEDYEYNCEAIADGLALVRTYDRTSPIDFTTTSFFGAPYTAAVARTENTVAVDVTCYSTYEETAYNACSGTAGVTTVVGNVFDITYVGALSKRDLTRTAADGTLQCALIVEWAKDATGQMWTLDDGSAGSVQLLKVSSPEFRVNAVEEPDPVTGALHLQNQTNAAVAIDADGDFVITWQSTVSDSSSVSDIYARRFSPQAYISNPTSLGAAEQPATSTNLYSSVVLTTRTDSDTAVVTLSEASYLDVGDAVDVYWPSTTTGSNGLRQQMTVVATTTTASGTRVTLDGGYGADLPSAGTQIKLLGYKWVNGVRALGSEFVVNTNTANSQTNPHVAMNDAGDFVIAWQSEGQNQSYFNAVRAQRFNLDGQRVGNEWRVNREDTAEHLNPYVAMTNDTMFAIVWETSRTDSFYSAVLCEIYDFNAAAAPATVDPTFGPTPTYSQFIVQAPSLLLSGYRLNPTAAFESLHPAVSNSSVSYSAGYNLVISWDECRSTDNIVTSSVLGVSGRMDVMAIQYRVDIAPTSTTTTPTTLRPVWRVNSANFTATTRTMWPLNQTNNQAAVDADGDLTIIYDGYGPDVYEANATVYELMGAANDVMFSQFDASTYTPEQTGAYTTVLASDSVVNSYRDGQNQIYRLTLDGRTTGGTFVLTLTTHDAEAGTGTENVTVTVVTTNLDTIAPTDTTTTILDRSATRTAIDVALQSSSRTGRNWTNSSVTTNSSILVTETDVWVSDESMILNVYAGTASITGRFTLLLDTVRNQRVTSYITFDYEDLDDADPGAADTTSRTQERIEEAVRLALVALGYTDATVTVELLTANTTPAFPYTATVPATLNSPPLQYQFLITFGGAGDTGMSGKQLVRHIYQNNVPTSFSIDSTEITRGSTTVETEVLSFYGTSSMKGDVLIRLGTDSEVQTISFASETDRIAFRAKPVSGVFRIGCYDQTTGNTVYTDYIDYDASADEVADALNACSAIASYGGEMYVTKSVSDAGLPSYDISFQGGLADGDQPLNMPYGNTIAAFTVDTSTLEPASLNTTPPSEVALVTEVTKGTGRNEVQRVYIDVPATVTGATFTLTFDPDGTGSRAAQTTGSLNYGATAAQVQNALNSLTNIYQYYPSGSVIVRRWGSGVTTDRYYYDIVFVNGAGFRQISNTSFGGDGALIRVNPSFGASSLATSVTPGQVAGPTAGSWTASFNGETTVALSYSATTFEVEAALNSLSTIGGIGGMVTVSQGQTAHSYVVTFGGELGMQDVNSITAASVSGSLNPNIAPTVVETQMGAPTAWVYFDSQDLEGTALRIQDAIENMRPGYPGVTVVRRAVPDTWPSPKPVYQFLVSFTGDSAGVDAPSKYQGNDVIEDIDADLVTNWAAETQTLRIDGLGSKPWGLYKLHILNPDQENHLGEYLETPYLFFDYDALPDSAAAIKSALNDLLGTTGITVDVVPATATQTYYDFTINFAGDAAAFDYGPVTVSEAPHPFSFTAETVQASTAEVQYLNFYTTPTNFTLSVGSYTTASITFNANYLVTTADNMTDALEALGFAGVVVTAQSPVAPFPDVTSDGVADTPLYQFKVVFDGASKGKNYPDITSNLTAAQFATSKASSKTQLLNLYGDLSTSFTFTVGGQTVTYTPNDSTTTAQSIAAALAAAGYTATVTHGTDPAYYPYSYVNATDADVTEPDDQYVIVFSSSKTLVDVVDSRTAEGDAIRVAAKDVTSGPRDGVPEIQELQFYSPTPADAQGYFTLICGEQQIYTQYTYDIESSKIYFDVDNPTETAWNIKTALENLTGWDGSDRGYDGVDVQFMADTGSSPVSGSAGRYRVVFGGESASKNVPDIEQGDVPVTFTSTSTERTKGHEEVQYLNFYGPGTMTGNFTLVVDAANNKTTDEMYFNSSNLVAMQELIEDELGEVSGNEVQSLNFGSEADTITLAPSASPTAKVVSSITRSGTTATVTLANHGLITGEVVTISGAEQGAYNGTFAVTVLDANRFTYTVANTLATPATGTIKAQAQTPADGTWSLTFSYDWNGDGTVASNETGIATFRYDATRYAVQDALNNLAAISTNAGYVTVTNTFDADGAVNPYGFLFTFGGALANLPIDAAAFTVETRHLYAIAADGTTHVGYGAMSPTRVTRGIAVTSGTWAANGVWSLSFKGETTTTFTGLESAANVAAALNALSTITAAGGVNVELVGDSQYLIVFKKQGEIGSQITVNSSVAPFSTARAIVDYIGVEVEYQSVVSSGSGTAPTYQYQVTWSNEGDTIIGGTTYAWQDLPASQSDPDLLTAGQLPVRFVDTQVTQGATVSEVQYLNIYGPATGEFTLVIGNANFGPITFLPSNVAQTARNIETAINRTGLWRVKVEYQTVTTTSRMTPEYQFRITFIGRSAGIDVPSITAIDLPVAFSVDSHIYTIGRTDAQYDISFIGESHDRAFELELASSALVGLRTEEEAIIIINTAEEGYFALGYAGVSGKTADIFFDPEDPWRVASAIQSGLRGLLSTNSTFDRLYVEYIEGSTYQFRVTYGGTLSGINQPDIQTRTPDHVYDRTNIGDDPNITAITIRNNQPMGSNIGLTNTLAESQRGSRGKSQTYASIGMEPDGDFTVSWVQYSGDLTNGAAATTDALYVRRFEESTDTAGPLVTDILTVDGDRVASGEQIQGTVSYIIITFDENMMTNTSLAGCVTDLSNWALLVNGVVLNGGIYHVEFGMNRARDLGLSNTGSNKYEAVLYLDGDATTSGAQALKDGNYQIVALNSLRDKAGNPLGRTGWQINGASWSRKFSVFNSSSGEVLVNANGADGTDYTSGNQPADPDAPQSSRQVAYDGYGNYIVVWTSDSADGKSVQAKIYYVDAGGNVTGSKQVSVVASLDDDTYYAYPSVACDEDGDFVVTWSECSSKTNNWDIYYRRYDACGRSLMTVPLPVNSETNDIQKYSTVAMDADGDFVITWQSLNQEDDDTDDDSGTCGYGIYAQRYGATGETVGGDNEIQLMNFVSNPLGEFTISWGGFGPSEAITFAGDTSTVADAIADVFAGWDVDVEVSYQSDTQVMIEFTGDYGAQNWDAIQISSAPSAGHIGVTTQQDGSSGEFLVNDTTVNNQMWPDIAMADDGSFVITWTSTGQGTDAAYQTNIYAKQFGSNAIYTTSRTAESYTDATLSADNQSRVVTTDSPANHVVTSPSGYDGVVQINRAGGAMLGSGALLTSKMHILTAAHLFCDSNGNQIVPSVDIVFTTSSGTVTLTSSEIYINPSYTGNYMLGGDLAIVVLPEAAPSSVRGYDIYTGTDEVGKTFTLVGYGYGGTGTTGQTLAAGTKRSGQNRYEMLGSALTAPFGTSTSNILVYDFDSGSSANDTLGYYYGIYNNGLGNAEVNSASGDSGAPTFIGGRIAGVVSSGITGYVTDAVAGTNSSFGELSFDTRVSSYATWIKQVTAGGGTEFLVNTTTTGNQKWSSVAMDADGDFVVTWTSYNQDGVGNGYGAGINGENGIFAQRYNSSGVKVRNEFQVNTFADGNQQWSRVSMDSDGDFVIVWESYQDRPEAPYAANDEPNSYGIYAQRYAANADLGDAFLGVNGEIGSELAVNVTKDGNQRYPSVASDNNGDFVIVWSGYGDQDNQVDRQGVFYRLYMQKSDSAPPTVAGVYDVAHEDGVLTTAQQIMDYSTIEIQPDGDTEDGINTSYGVTEFIVTFSEPLSTEDGADGVNSVLNVNNWELYWNSRLVEAGISKIEVVTGQVAGVCLAHRVAYRVYFDADSSTTALDGLDYGTYELVISPNVEDVDGNALDGNFDGIAGGEFNLTFSIVPVGDTENQLFPCDPYPNDADYIDKLGNTELVNNQNDVVIAYSTNNSYYVMAWVSYGQDGDTTSQGNIVAKVFRQDGTVYRDEFVVNTYTLGHQCEPDVVMIGNTLVFTWSGAGIDPETAQSDDTGIWARCLDINDTAAEWAESPQYLVNDFDSDPRYNDGFVYGIQQHPSIAANGNKDVVITWASWGDSTYDGYDPNVVDTQGYGVYYRCYYSYVNPTGNGGRVNTTTAGDQTYPDVAMDKDGDFTIVWQSDSQDGASWGVYAQNFSAGGSKTGSEYRVNEYTANSQMYPQIAMANTGTYVITWCGSGSEDDSGIFARRYTAEGTAAGSTFLVNTDKQTNIQTQPAIDMSEDGRYVAITWMSFDQDDTSQDSVTDANYGIYCHIYDFENSDFELDNLDKNSTAPLGAFRVNYTVSGDQTLPSVAIGKHSYKAGRVPTAVVAWSSSDGSGVGVYYSHFMDLEYVQKSTTSSSSTSTGVRSSSGSTAYYSTTDVTNVILQSQLGTTTPGLFDPVNSVFYLRDSNDTGCATYTFGYGVPNGGWTAVMGDWDGDGAETIGFYDPATSLFYLRNSNTVGYADYTFGFGAPGAGWLPLVGDWNGDGTDSIGLFDPTTSIFYLRNSLSTGNAQITFGFGAPGAGWTPLMGDWDGDGTDTLALFDPTTSLFYLRNTNNTGCADITFGYGAPNSGWTPMSGDWNSDGRDTIGFYISESSTFVLRNTNDTGCADLTFGYGAPGAGWLPVVGQWDGPDYLTLAVDSTTVGNNALAATVDVEPLSADDLSSLVVEAIGRWADAGLDSQAVAVLANTQVKIAALPAGKLGMVYEGTLYLDDDAAGMGWFVDTTPADDEEFVATDDGTLTAVDAAAVDQIDLLTVVAHELGHLAGLEDLDSSVDNVMSATLGTGVRRLPELAATDAIFGSDDLDN
jgi:putative transposon-encoded protein